MTGFTEFQHPHEHPHPEPTAHVHEIVKKVYALETTANHIHAALQALEQFQITTAQTRLQRALEILDAIS